MNIQLILLQGLKTAYDADPAAVVSFISAGEGGIEAFIANALTELKPTGVLGTVYGFLEPKIMPEITALVAKDASPATVYALLDALLAKAIAGATAPAPAAAKA